MSEDYKPGTVAKATVRGVPDVTVMRTTGTGGGDDFWVTAQHIRGWRSHTRTDVTDVRPLVLLDPDSLYGPECDFDWPYVINTLRSEVHGKATRRAIADQVEAQTKPPRIPEPGLWGVVEATFKDGRSRHGWAVRRLTDGEADWQDGTGEYHNWDDLIDPFLIREGVEQ